MSKIVKLAAGLILLPWLSRAQDFPLNPVSPAGWKAVQGKWNLAGNLSLNPFENKATVSAGNQLIYTSAAAEIETPGKYRDLKFEFEFLQSNETEAVLNIGNGFEINLNNTSGGQMPYLGSVVGSANALQNVCKASGLWNKAELTFIQGRSGEPAILEKLIINGIAVHRNVLKWGLPVSESPLKVKVKKGTLAIRNAAVLAYGDRQPISVSNISYRLQETESWQSDFAPKDTPPITGKSDVLTARIDNAFRHFSLISTGDMDVKEAGKYAFTLDYQGIASLKIDGKEVVGSPEIIFRTPVTGMVDLSSGKHTFEYSYKRIWWPAGLGLFVSGPDFRAYRLHDATSLPDPRITGGIFVEPTPGKAKLVRSFMQFGEEKKTQVISVGTSLQRHFAFDLGSGSPLYGWKGNFADVTEMWYERGEPQLIKATGPKITFSGKPGFMIDEKSEPLKLEEYYLDKEGIPTFNFRLNGQLVSQKLIPTKRGITVEVGSETDKALFLLASAEDLTQVNKSLYQTAGYYIKVPENVKVTKKESGGKTEIWAVANQLKSFEIIW